jgi:hypothetical protein
MYSKKKKKNFIIILKVRILTSSGKTIEVARARE